MMARHTPKANNINSEKVKSVGYQLGIKVFSLVRIPRENKKPCMTKINEYSIANNEIPTSGDIKKNFQLSGPINFLSFEIFSIMNNTHCCIF